MLGNMSQAPRQLVRPALVANLVVALVLALLVCVFLPMLGGSRRGKLPRIVMNLARIGAAKEMWASDRAATNGAAVSNQDLIPFLGEGPGSTGWIASVDSEVYRVNPVGVPPETRLESAYGGGSLPKGTRLRWSKNAGCEKLLPNQQGGANGWQPLYSWTNRAAPEAATRRSP
jgi:hypothetical protein